MGAVNPCPTCPSGFAYLTSNGNSTKHSGSFQLRRRLHNGFTSTVQYTFSKAIDDASLGGGRPGGGPAASVVAQDWLNLAGERGLSGFDQRHLLNLQGSTAPASARGGGTLLDGWRGAIVKDWTFITSSHGRQRSAAQSGVPGPGARNRRYRTHPPPLHRRAAL